MNGYFVSSALAFLIFVRQGAANEPCSEGHVDFAWETIGEMDFQQGLRYVMCPDASGRRIGRAGIEKMEGAEVLDAARVNIAFGAFRKGTDIKCDADGRPLPPRATYQTFLQKLVVTFEGAEIRSCSAISRSFITSEHPAEWEDDSYKTREASCAEFQKIARANCPESEEGQQAVE